MEYRVVERDARDLLGEGPIWSARRNALFWVDIMAPALNRLDLVDGTVARWAMPERIGWAIERESDDRFMIGLKSGFARLTLAPFTIEMLGDPEPDRPDNRLNDAKVDPAGRIWTGSKDDRDQDASGALYRLDPDLRWSRHDDGYVVTNGPTFSLDGRILYHSDSGRREVYAFDLAADGAIDNRRLFVRFEEEWGYPDGMTTDSGGGIWIAHWDGGRVSRFAPDGSLDRSIMLPARNVTSICFAGPALDRMFVTSSGQDLSGPADGALFELFAGATGMAQRAFAG